ncbi:MAG: tetratricopeptide repeat protein, partial [Pirellulaceae bacterium]|nr:tetratricopeptide repeat protein [Pirellulaceae bacterium]
NRGHRRGALIARAWLLDQDREAAVENAASPAKSELIKAYQQLLDFEAPNNSQLKEDAVMRTALFRLAQLQLETGQFPQAAKAFARLHQIRPTQLPYLEGLATAEMGMGDRKNAAAHWRVIIAAFSPGSEIWLKAKYNLILCLQETQPSTAQALYQQVRVLVPELPLAWKARFDRLPFSIPDIP